MKLQKMKQPNTCLLTSFAMCLGVDQILLLDQIGHNGSEEKWPELKPPHNTIGHHPQELIDCCLAVDYSVIRLVADPITGWAQSEIVHHVPVAETRLIDAILNYDTTVIVFNTHSVACDGHTIYDPKGTTEEVISFIEDMIPQIKMVFIVAKMI